MKNIINKTSIVNKRYVLRHFISILAIVLMATCSADNKKVCLLSPNKSIEVRVAVNTAGKPYYQVFFENKMLLDTSAMGLVLSNDIDLRSDLYIADNSSSYFKEVWHPKTGDFKNILNEYNEILVSFKSKKNDSISLTVVFRIFDEGVAFRYKVSHANSTNQVNIIAENTQFNIAGDPKAWWNEAHYDSYEVMYNTTRLSEAYQIIRDKKTLSLLTNEFYMKNFGGTIAFNTPLTLMRDDSIYLAFHEADLTKYAEMTLGIDSLTKTCLFSELVPWPDGIKVKTAFPFQSPWRTIHITKNSGDLLISHLEENLNAPSVIKDDSYINPVKYMGVWWGYHIGKYTWDPRGARGAADGNDPRLKKKPHGASNENVIKYIDFASDNNIPFLLIEGWNPTNYSVDSVDNFLKTHPDFDLKKLVDYGKTKNVEIVIHNETMGQVNNFLLQIDSAFARYQQLGIRALKIGFAWHLETKNFNRAWGSDSASVALYTGGKYYQHSQWAVEQYRTILEKAAQYNQMVCLHEYIKETGIRRTYPNLMALEGLRGNEYNAWDKGRGNLPEHVTIVPFTRQLAGPIDYTPGIFNILFDEYKKDQRVNATLANQLALFVVFYSPLVMAADLPEHYDGHPAFEFIKNVPCDWDTTLVLNAAIGDYVTVARKNNKDWFLGAVTDENKRTLSVPLNFLPSNATFTAIQYADGDSADWKSNPTDYKITSTVVTNKNTFTLNLAAGGGAAIHFKSNPTVPSKQNEK